MRGGFVWIGLLPAVPRVQSLNMTPSSVVSIKVASETITGLAAKTCQVAAK